MLPSVRTIFSKRRPHGGLGASRDLKKVEGQKIPWAEQRGSAAYAFTPYTPPTFEDQEFYLEDPTFFEWITHFFSRRLAWASVFILFCAATIPLAIKIVLNIATGELKTAVINFIYLIALPLVGFISLAGVIKPSWSFLRNIIRQLILPNQISTEEAKKPEGQFPVKVRATNGHFIDTVEVPCAKPTEKYLIRFNSNGSTYQNSDHVPTLNYHVRRFNYPRAAESISDLVNAGISEVYALKKKNKWTLEQLRHNLRLSGHSLGGVIAILVALHFKQTYGINIKTFADRPFSSLHRMASAHLTKLTGMPAWFSDLLAPELLHGTGNWDVDLIEALKQLDPKYIVFVNLKRRASPETTCKASLGLGRLQPSADPIILDKASLTYAVEQATREVGSTAKIMQSYLENKQHNVYFCSSEGVVANIPKNEGTHNCSLQKLITEKDAPADEIYQHWLESDTTSQSAPKRKLS